MTNVTKPASFYETAQKRCKTLTKSVIMLTSTLHSYDEQIVSDVRTGAGVPFDPVTSALFTGFSCFHQGNIIIRDQGFVVGRPEEGLFNMMVVMSKLYIG